MIDIHNHVLFDVDDGVKTLEESIKILKEYNSHGIKYVVLTPHVNHPTIKTDTSVISNHYASLTEASKNIGVNIFLGCELYLTPRADKFIPILDRFLLVELDTLTYPLYLFDKIFDLQLEGYEIILAHVERYQWLKENRRVLKKLKDMNVYFQMNINSTKEDNFFLKEGLIEFIATDYHGSERSTINWEMFKKYQDLIEKSMKILKIK